MNTLIRFLLRYHTLLLFLLLQGVAVTLIVRTSTYQQAEVMGTVQVVRSWVYDGIADLTAYFSLRKENERLQGENTLLRNQLNEYLTSDTIRTVQQYDTVLKESFTYMSARVVQSTTNQQHNFITINVGQKQGVKADMAVVSSAGAVGVVTKVSENYSNILPIINIDSHTSAKLLRTNCSGTLLWKGGAYREVNLTDIPQHIDVQKGDTVVTSGFSLIFPQGIMLGTVENFEIKKGNFYEIRVALSVDFKRLQDVYVLKSAGYPEIDSLSVGGYK